MRRLPRRNFALYRDIRRKTDLESDSGFEISWPKAFVHCAQPRRLTVVDRLSVTSYEIETGTYYRWRIESDARPTRDSFKTPDSSESIFAELVVMNSNASGKSSSSSSDSSRRSASSASPNGWRKGGA